MGYQEWLDWLREQDPDVLVDILRLDSRDIVEKFEDEAEQIYKEGEQSED